MATTTSASTGSAIRISVVLPTRGRMDLLDRCLDALTRQSLPASAYEVIVVDDEPNHNTLHFVAGWRTRTLDRGPRLVYLANAGPHGAAAARNLGWRAAQGAIVAFTGDDTVPSSAWLATGLAAFGDEVDVLCGGVAALLPALPPDPGRADAQAMQTGLCLANCFCRKSMLERIEGFDERFYEACHDDADLHFRLIGAGARIVRAPQVEVARPTPPARWGASLAHARRAVFDALLYKKHPHLYRERIGAHLPWEYYLAAAALPGMVGLLVAGNRVGFAAACAGWLVLTARICLRAWRRLRGGGARVAEVLVTCALYPPLAVFWRLAGAVRYRVRFA